MKIELPGVDAAGNHRTRGPDVRFTFDHRGQAFVRRRLSWDMDKPPIAKAIDGDPFVNGVLVLNVRGRRPAARPRRRPPAPLSGPARPPA